MRETPYSNPPVFPVDCPPMKTTSTLPPRTIPAPARFGAMMDAAPHAARLRALGFYVEMTDNAEHLSGAAYAEATRDFRWEITAREFAPGDGATVRGYSDADAYTVVARTAKTLTLQQDKQTLLNGTGSGAPDALQFSPGGFVGHTSGRQRWECSPDASGRTVTARLTLKGWSADGKSVGAGRRPHYDFNF